MASSGRNAYRLFVSSLPWTTNSQKLKTYFSRFGQVNSASVVFDKKTGLSRGYGFVNFNNQIGYDAALKTQKHVIEGNTVNIEQGLIKQ